MVLLSGTAARCQYVTDDEIREKLFTLEVKQIDEFLERFNDEHFSFIREQANKIGTGHTLSRPLLVAKLFNLDAQWNKDTVLAFLHLVLNPEKPVLLSFTDSNWYAQAECRFLYKGKKVNVPLFLRVSTTNPTGARWAIAGVGNPSFFGRLPAAPLPAPSSGTYHFIPSSSHINRFLSLYRAFGDTTNLVEYFDPLALTDSSVNKLITGLHSRSLKLIAVKQVMFHFFQIDGWFFTVERFERNTTNKGWLINRLINIPESEKGRLLSGLLHPIKFNR